ncbi:hypothetical protein GO290_05239 [Ralstonia solanacearum]|nr:hypothetical protein [Ralstonia solanacearum]NKF98114.1 hypothetical protein [Ralstonia solanacearum]
MPTARTLGAVTVMLPTESTCPPMFSASVPARMARLPAAEIVPPVVDTVLDASLRQKIMQLRLKCAEPVGNASLWNTLAAVMAISPPLESTCPPTLLTLRPLTSVPVCDTKYGTWPVCGMEP